LIASLVVAGCASGGRAGTSDRNRITAEQLANVTAANAYEAIRILQPQWLDSRGVTSVTDATPSTAVVFIDGTRAGDLEYLRSVPLNSLAEMRFLTPGEAGTRYGMGLQRGVIELISKGR
jgi:hypothetical protein